MNELHLFAGIGGGILGGMLLGHQPVCAVEIDEYCRKVLVQRQRDGILPRFPIWDDIRTFDGTPWRGIARVVCGGFPCQDISSSGKGEGIEGSKSGLWSEMRRVVGDVRPEFVFVENSPLLVQRGLALVLGDLASLGYDAKWTVLGADSCGYPHHRARLWLVAHAERGEWRDEPCDGPAGRMGRFFKSLATDTDWQMLLAGVRGNGHGIPNRVDRTDGIRNAQVPAVAATAFSILS